LKRGRRGAILGFVDPAEDDAMGSDLRRCPIETGRTIDWPRR
jgi:hypothetical protein